MNHRDAQNAEKLESSREISEDNYCMKTNPQDLNPRGFYFFAFFYMIIMECEDMTTRIYNITYYFSTNSPYYESLGFIPYKSVHTTNFRVLNVPI